MASEDIQHKPARRASDDPRHMLAQQVRCKSGVRPTDLAGWQELAREFDHTEPLSVEDMNLAWMHGMLAAIERRQADWRAAWLELQARGQEGP